MSRSSSLAKRQEWTKRLARYQKNRTGRSASSESMRTFRSHHFVVSHVPQSGHDHPLETRSGDSLGSDLAVAAAVVKPLLEAAHSESSHGGPSC
jgi:hypothetical protein